MSIDIEKRLDSNPDLKVRSASWVNQKVRMDGKNNTTDALNNNAFTPYGKMQNEEEYDPYRDDLSDAHNISIAEAVEEEWDIKKRGSWNSHGNVNDYNNIPCYLLSLILYGSDTNLCWYNHWISSYRSYYLLFNHDTHDLFICAFCNSTSIWIIRICASIWIYKRILDICIRRLLRDANRLRSSILRFKISDEVLSPFLYFWQDKVISSEQGTY